MNCVVQREKTSQSCWVHTKCAFHSAAVCVLFSCSFELVRHKKHQNFLAKLCHQKVTWIILSITQDRLWRMKYSSPVPPWFLFQSVWSDLILCPKSLFCFGSFSVDWGVSSLRLHSESFSTVCVWIQIFHPCNLRPKELNFSCWLLCYYFLNIAFGFG